MTADPPPLRAVHTPNFPTLLRQLGASFLITTYQTGKLVMLRDEGDHAKARCAQASTNPSIPLSGQCLPVHRAVLHY
jgi:hypothetical protein